MLTKGSVKKEAYYAIISLIVIGFSYYLWYSGSTNTAYPSTIIIGTPTDFEMVISELDNSNRMIKTEFTNEGQSVGLAKNEYRFEVFRAGQWVNVRRMLPLKSQVIARAISSDEVLSFEHNIIISYEIKPEHYQVAAEFDIE